MIAASPVLTIAQRDFTKLMRDPARIAATFVFPVAFIVLLGGSLQASFGPAVGFNFLLFVFTGVYAQTLFQSAALGLISLIEDRENDFSQEIFVSPVSRYSIVFGKILGESLVALPQGLAIIPLGWLLAGPFSAAQLLALLWVAIVVCLFGGAFGLLVLSSLRSQRAANQVFPFIMLPQFFLAGVFNPLENLPWYLEILSRLSPMRYAVDLTRGVFYAGLPTHDAAVVDPLPLDAAVIAGSFLIFIVVGTAMFVRAERNR